jgi:hypothetical protein
MKSSLTILLLAITFSCTISEKKGQESTTLNVLKQLSPETDFSGSLFVLIIPFDGCSSCFDDAISLIPKVNKKPNLIIMPNINKRVVYNTLADLGIDQSTILLDTLQLSVREKLVETNPRIYLVNNNEISFSETVDYSTIDKIRKMIERE